MAVLKAERFTTLKSKVKAEVLRRNKSGSVAGHPEPQPVQVLGHPLPQPEQPEGHPEPHPVQPVAQPV